MAAKNGCNEAAQLLLAHGAVVEAKANVCFLASLVSFFFFLWNLVFLELSSYNVLFMQNGMTPLHLAVWYSLRAEDCSTVKTLLEYNADCSSTDNVIIIAIPGHFLSLVLYALFVIGNNW